MNKYNICSKMWTDTNINFQSKTFRHCCKQIGQWISLEEIDSLGPDVFEKHESNIENRKIAIEQNELPPACKWCIDTAPNNIKQVWNIWNDDIIEYKLPNLLHNNETTYIDLDIGKSCDLACVYCGPWSSTTWAKELDQPANNVIDQTWKTKVLDNLKEYLLNFDSDRDLTFNILGGEPLLIVDTYDIILYLSESCKHFNKKPVLMITTNLNCKPALLKRLLETIEKTRNIFSWNLSVSIEDIDKRAEAVRYHLDFENFENNLNAVKNKVDHLYLTTTFSIFSFANFHEFFNWSFDILGKNNYTRNWDYSLNNVQEGFTDLAYCPKELIDIDYIKNSYYNNIDGIKVDAFKKQNVIDHLDNMYSRAGTKNINSQFIGFWEQMNLRRNLNYFEIYPLTKIKNYIQEST